MRRLLPYVHVKWWNRVLSRKDTKQQHLSPKCINSDVYCMYVLSIWESNHPKTWGKRDILVLEPEKWYPNLIQTQYLLPEPITTQVLSSVELSEFCNKYEQFDHSICNVEVAQLVEQSTFTHFCGSNPSSGEIFISVSVTYREKLF